MKSNRQHTSFRASQLTKHFWNWKRMDNPSDLRGRLWVLSFGLENKPPTSIMLLRGWRVAPCRRTLIGECEHSRRELQVRYVACGCKSEKAISNPPRKAEPIPTKPAKEVIHGGIELYYEVVIFFHEMATEKGTPSWPHTRQHLMKCDKNLIDNCFAPVFFANPNRHVDVLLTAPSQPDLCRSKTASPPCLELVPVKR